MSSFTAESFGIQPEDDIGCVGTTIQKFQKCILTVHENETIWNKLQSNEIKYIQKTHNRQDVMKTWDDVIVHNLNQLKDIRKKGDKDKMKHNLMTAEVKLPTEACPEGEKLYGRLYPLVAKQIKKRKTWATCFEHFQLYGRLEGRVYICE